TVVMPARAISAYVARARARNESGSSRDARSYISARQVQKEPAPRWVRPRNARWNTCECAFTKPGSVTPARLVASGGHDDTPVVTDHTESPSISSTTPDSTSGSTSSPPSHARSHQSRSVTSGLAHRHSHPALLRDLDGAVVARVDVPDHARPRVAGVAPFELLGRELAAAGDAHHAGMDRPAD